MIVIALHYAAIFYDFFGYHLFCLVSGRPPGVPGILGHPNPDLLFGGGNIAVYPARQKTGQTFTDNQNYLGNNCCDPNYPDIYRAFI